MRPAAYEVDDLQVVALFQSDFGPAIAGHDFAVQFDGYAVGFHAQRFDQGGEGRCGRWVREVSRLAVDVEVHGSETIV